jgi:hypothetical protein
LQPVSQNFPKNPTSISYIIFHLQERETTKLLAYGSAPLGKFNSAMVVKNMRCSMKFPEKMKMNPNNPQYVLPNENYIIS